MKHQKALFLDRDGVINVDHGYVFDPKDIDFMPGIFALTQAFRKAGYLVIVVTNQSGIGRGYYSEQQFASLTQWMREQFQQQGSDLDDVYFCPHHPSKAKGTYQQLCDCRKPNPGMLVQAITKHNIDPSVSVMVGDKLSDMLAAQKAGVAHRILFQNHEPTVVDAPEGIHVVRDLQDIISLIGQTDSGV